jgi:recombination protein RecR
MESYTESLQALIRELARLPGIGRKTAERLAYHLLRASTEEAMALAEAIRVIKTSVRNCRQCFNLTEQEVCAICNDPRRDRTLICVVEQHKDLHAIEDTGEYHGLYHVLLGAFAPLDGVRPQDLTIDPLVARVRRQEKAGAPVREVILATNPNFEGDGTALYVAGQLKAFSGLTISRIARGVPSGSSLEHVSRTIVADALEGRRSVDG